MLVMLWGAFAITSLLLEQHNNENVEFIPENSVFVARIDGRKLLKEGLSSVILQEDNEIISLIEKLTTDRSDTSGISNRPGINFNSDIVFFTILNGENKLFGALFNLNSPKKFNENLPNLLKSHQSFSSNGHIGVVLSESISNDVKPFNKKELKSIAIDLIKEKQDFPFEEVLSFPDDNTMAKTWSEQGFLKNSDVFSNSNLSFSVNEHILDLYGTLEISSNKESLINKQLKPKGTHLTILQLSEIANDSITKLLDEFNLETANINGLSINFYGTEIIEEPSFVIVPKFDALLYFESNFDVKTNIDSLTTQGIIEEYTDDYLLYGGCKFYYKQINSQTIYIGKSKNPEYQDFDKSTIVEVSGSLEPLTLITGTGIMKKFIEIISIFSASKGLSEKIDEIDFRMIRGEKDIVKLKGELKFKEGYHPLNSILKFGLEGQLIK